MPAEAKIRVRCPNPACKKVLAVKASMGGKKGKCPFCGQVMTIPVPPPAPAAKPPAPVEKPEEKPAPPPPAEKPKEEAPPKPQPEPSGTRAAPPPSSGPQAAQGPPPRPEEQLAPGPPRGQEAAGVAPATPQQSAPPERVPAPPEEKVAAPAEAPAAPQPPPAPIVLPEALRQRYELSPGLLRVKEPFPYELDPDFRALCNQLLESAGEAPEILLDLSAVPYLSSTYLGVIAPVLGMAKQVGKTARVRLKARVAKIFRLAGLDSLGVIEEVED